MAVLLTAEAMRAREAAAIASGRVSGRALMAAAGHGAVDALLARWLDLARPGGHAHALVLCGPGNNGGDGFVIARLLRARGWRIDLFLLGALNRLPPDAAHAARLWGEGAVRRFDADAVLACTPSDLIVDALFGTGLTRDLDTELVGCLAGLQARRAGERVLAVDCASGLDMDTGALRTPGGEGVLFPDLTVTFHAAKPGHMLCPAGLQGALVTVALPGMMPASTVNAGDVHLVSPALGTPARPWPQSDLSARVDHKFDRGHALILSGGVGQGGAARMAARGALRIGAGLVTLGCPPAALQENAARLDAIMLRSLVDAPALAAMLEDPRLTALCVGPGLGLGERVVQRNRDLVLSALASGRPCVLDADALTLFAAAPETLFSALHEGCVLTPHMGEFARLFPDLAADLRDKPGVSKIAVTRAAAARCGAVVLLKGAATVIAAPDGRTSLHAALRNRAAPNMATAGAGDVLAGFITGLMAQHPGADSLRLAEIAVWLHVECALSFGPGLIAEDLPEMLPGVLRNLDRQSPILTGSRPASL